MVYWSLSSHTPSATPKLPGHLILMALTLLQELLDVSERAAEIARLIRAERELFGALIEEKENDHIKQDYKTLADVLIQATVKYHVATKVQ